MDKTFEGFLKNKKSARTYKSFIKRDLEDCLIDLQDDGFSIKCELTNKEELSILIDQLEGRFENKEKESIKIFITRERNFKFTEVKENLLFTLPYLEDLYGLKLKDIVISYMDDEYKASHISNIKSKIFDKIDIDLMCIVLKRI